MLIFTILDLENLSQVGPGSSGFKSIKVGLTKQVWLNNVNFTICEKDFRDLIKLQKLI